MGLRLFIALVNRKESKSTMIASYIWKSLLYEAFIK